MFRTPQIVAVNGVSIGAVMAALPPMWPGFVCGLSLLVLYSAPRNGNCSFLLLGFFLNSCSSVKLCVHFHFHYVKDPFLV